MPGCYCQECDTLIVWPGNKSLAAGMLCQTCGKPFKIYSTPNLIPDDNELEEIFGVYWKEVKAALEKAASKLKDHGGSN